MFAHSWTNSLGHHTKAAMYIMELPRTASLPLPCILTPCPGREPTHCLPSPGPGGGAYAFLTVGQFVPSGLYPDDSLLVNSVNLNGLDCSRVLPDPGLTLGCSQDDDGSSGGTVAQGGCRAVYCCGYVLSTPAALPPATENGGAVPAAPPIAGTPTAPIESTGDTGAAWTGGGDREGRRRLH